MILTRAQYDSLDYREKCKYAENSGVPKESFILCALECAKVVVPFVREDRREACYTAIETVDSCLIDEASIEACRQASDFTLVYENTPYHSTAKNPKVSYHAMRCISLMIHLVIRAHEEIHSWVFYAGDSIISAIYVFTKVYSAADDKEISKIADKYIRKYIRWEDTLAYQIAEAISATSETSHLEIVGIIANLAKSTRDSLFQYAELILESDGLREEFGFLMKSFIDTVV